MDPIISVIIPVYNGEDYIEKIVNSLEKQSFQCFEAIFINDGSTDNSEKILTSVILNGSGKYKVLHQRNRGVSAARNVGIDAANGKYITFVDVDDQLHPFFFELMLEQINDSDVVSICRFGDTVASIDKKKISIVRKKQEELLEDFLYGNLHTGVCGIVVARDLLKKHGLYFKEGFRYSEDLHMIWRIFCHIKEAKEVEAPLYIYNMVENSAMTKMDNSRFDSIELISDLNSYIKKECPDFYLQFDTFAVPRMSWSLLWQAAHFLRYKEFIKFIEQYDFKTDMKKILLFPKHKVAVSAQVFLFSKKLYYLLANIATFQYRRPAMKSQP